MEARDDLDLGVRTLLGRAQREVALGPAQERLEPLDVILHAPVSQHNVVDLMVPVQDLHDCGRGVDEGVKRVADAELPHLRHLGRIIITLALALERFRVL